MLEIWSTVTLFNNFHYHHKLILIFIIIVFLLCKEESELSVCVIIHGLVILGFAHCIPQKKCINKPLILLFKPGNRNLKKYPKASGD